MNGFISSVCLDCNNSISIENWELSKIINPNYSTGDAYAVLILNRPITQKQQYFMELWNNAIVRLTVDGGTRQWDKYINNLSDEMQQAAKLPELVTGDFDSITDEILLKYRTKGCEIIHTPDQNYTDFTKALVELNKYCHRKNITIDSVIVIGQTSGRFDHIMANVQTLFLSRENELVSPRTKVYLMSDDTLSWLLYPGEHHICIPEEIRRHKKPWCSLVPIGEKCESITTQGLKWNLENQKLQFGNLVSTSNTYDGSPIVTVICSHSILWTMKVPSLLL